MNNQRFLWFVLLANVAWGLMMYVEASQYRTPCPVGSGTALTSCKTNAPIAELELTRSPQQFCDLIDQSDAGANQVWNTEVVRVNTCMDFFFILLYWGSISLLAKAQENWLFYLISPLVTLAAAFDVAENVYLFKALHGVAQHQRSFPVPGAASAIKWSLFASALLFLSISVALKKKIGPVLIAILTLLAAVCTMLGVTYVPFLTRAVLSLFGALIVAIVVYFPFRPFGWSRLLEWIEFAYLSRFPLVAAVLLAVLLPAGYFLAPSIFLGLFDVLSFPSFIFVAAACVSLAWFVMLTIRLVYIYGPGRFPGISRVPPAANLSWTTTLLFAALAGPCLAIAACGTLLPGYLKLTAMAVGAAIALGFLWIVAKFHFAIEPPPGGSARKLFPFPMQARTDAGRSAAGKLLDLAVQKSIPSQIHGGLLADDGRLHSGHQLAGFTLIGLIAVYGVIGLAYKPPKPASGPATAEAAVHAVQVVRATVVGPSVVPTFSGTHPPAALFYLLFLLSILTLLFSGVAFLLDKVRLPVLTTAIAFSFLVGMRGTDHLFPVTRSSGAEALSPDAAVRAWVKTRANGDPKKPIVVVATAGGGIRAAAWTAQVLTGLAEKNPSDFSSSLLLVSSVSGGSVGNMFIVGSYDARGQLDRNAMQAAQVAAEKTSLSAVGWGLLYPDFVRTVPLAGSLLAAHVFGEDVDRGSALEDQWLANWEGHVWQAPPTVRQWAHDVGNGMRPVTIFNATAVESGQRYLVASTVMNLERQDQDSMIQFAERFRQFDMPVSTAARLSATFPWVSPNPRMVFEKSPMGVHLADGGYYDNSGILSAIQWLRQAAAAIGDHPVLFVVIDSGQGEPPTGQSWSWQRQAIGPIETLLSVRDSSQVSRAKVELELALNELRNRDRIDIQEYDMLYPPDPLTPLNWHLTDEQKERIHGAWSKPNACLNSEIEAFAGKMKNPGSHDARSDNCKR